MVEVSPRLCLCGPAPSAGQYVIKTTWWTGEVDNSDEILSYEIGLCNP